MIKGVGCDIVKTERIETLMLNTHFNRKVFTPTEQVFISTKSVQSAAGLWAAKEAICKAFGTGFDGFAMQDIEIEHDENGKPWVKLYDGAKKRFEQLCGRQISISISHDGEYAIAFAIIE